MNLKFCSQTKTNGSGRGKGGGDLLWLLLGLQIFGESSHVLEHLVECHYYYAATKIPTVFDAYTGALQLIWMVSTLLLHYNII